MLSLPSRFHVSAPRPVGPDEWERFLYVESPTASDAYPLLFSGRRPGRMIYIAGGTDAGTVDFNVEVRSNLTPFTSGTDIMASELQATTSGATATSFSVRTWMEYSVPFYVSSAASSATKLLVTYVYSRGR